MLWILWLALAILNFGGAALDYLSRTWPLFFINSALGFLFVHQALEAFGKRAAGQEDE